MGAIVDPTQYEPLMILRKNWQVIRDECAALDRNDILNCDRSNQSYEGVAKTLVKNGRAQWVKAWGEHKDKWLNWGLAICDRYLLGDAGVPKTTSLLRQIRGLRVAALSLFKPGVLLPVHTHPELGVQKLLTFHLGLECPPACYLNVDGEFLQEENGKAITFDGSKPHYAFNASASDRLILYCEFSPEDIWANN